MSVRDELIVRLNEIIENHPVLEKKKLLTPFYKRIIKYMRYLLTFLFHPNVPADNNASERAIRNIKVKIKVSGGFRSSQGAQNYAIARSAIDTAIKNGQNVLNAIICTKFLMPKNQQKLMCFFCKTMYL